MLNTKRIFPENPKKKLSLFRLVFLLAPFIFLFIIYNPATKDPDYVMSFLELTAWLASIVVLMITLGGFLITAILKTWIFFAEKYKK